MQKTLFFTLFFSSALLGMARIEKTIDINGTSQTWSSDQGLSAGYPLLDGSTGVDSAQLDLGDGLAMTFKQRVVGHAKPYTQSGSQTGNLNRLDGSDAGIDASPSQTSPLANEMTGFAFSISSEGGDDNQDFLSHYIRYDLMFNQSVMLGDITITDIDALALWNPYFRVNLPVYEDAVLIESWESSPGDIGTGKQLNAAIGKDLAYGTIGELSYVHGVAPSGPAAGETGGLVDSSDEAHHAVFSTSNAVQGISIYYFDNLNNAITYDGGMTIGIANVKVRTTPEPSTFCLLTLASGMGLWLRKRL